MTTPYMLLTLPTDHNSSNLWGSMVNTALGTVDAHDHSPDKGKRVPSAGIGINADLTFASWAITNALAVDFVAAATLAVAGYGGALFMSDGSGGLSANDLYWRTVAGVNVKVTAGTSLNVAGFAGGIGGDYSAVGAQLNYDDSLKRYNFLEGTGDANGWARLHAGELRLSEFNTAEGAYVGQIAPAALAGTYTMTWPTALPAATHVLQIDNTGLISNTGSVAMATNENVTVSGTGAFKHGTQTLQLHGTMFQPYNGAANPTYATGAIGNAGVSAAGLSVVAPIILPRGKRITAIRAYIVDNVTGPTKLVLSYGTSDTTNNGTNLGSTAASAGSGAPQTLTLSSLTTTISASTSYWVLITTSTGAASCVCMMVEIDYDHP